MNRTEFILQYVLSRTSHKRDVNQLLDEANTAWNYANKTIEEPIVEQTSSEQRPPWED